MSTSKKTGGMTLTEVLISAGIIALALGGVLLLFAQTVDMSKRSGHEYASTSLAKNRLERLRRALVTHGFDLLDEFAEEDTRLNERGIEDPSGIYRRTTLIDEYPAIKPDARLKKITVIVIYRYRGFWRENAGARMAMVLTNITQG